MTTTEKKLTPGQARERIRAYLIRKYDLRGSEYARREAAEIALWNQKEATAHGWYGENSKGQVCWEGGPYEWAYELTEDFSEGKLELPGYWLECATSFIVTLYPKAS